MTNHDTNKPISNELLMEQMHAIMRQLKLVVELIAITNHKIDMIRGALKDVERYGKKRPADSVSENG